MQPGLTSVIIPTYNRAHLIEAALSSVRDQTCRPLQIIVVDDGSTDGTEATVGRWAGEHADRSLSVLYSMQENAGAPSARNHGLRLSEGEYVQFLDSDDLLLPQKIQLQREVLEADEEIMYVWSDWVIRSVGDTAGGAETTASPAGSSWQRIVGAEQVRVPGQVAHGLFRRTACEMVGEWDVTLERYQDWNYSVRLIAQNRLLAYLPGPQYITRWHDGPRYEDKEGDPVGKVALLVRAATRTKRQAVSLNLHASDERILQRLKIAATLSLVRDLQPSFELVRTCFASHAFASTRSRRQLAILFRLYGTLGFVSTARLYRLARCARLVS